MPEISSPAKWSSGDFILVSISSYAWFPPIDSSVQIHEILENDNQVQQKQKSMKNWMRGCILTFGWQWRWLVVEMTEFSISRCVRLQPALCPRDWWICSIIIEIGSQTEYTNQKHRTAKHILPFQIFEVATPFLSNTQGYLFRFSILIFVCFNWEACPH